MPTVTLVILELCEVTVPLTLTSLPCASSAGTVVTLASVSASDAVALTPVSGAVAAGAAVVVVSAVVSGAVVCVSSAKAFIMTDEPCIAREAAITPAAILPVCLFFIAYLFSFVQISVETDHRSSRVRAGSRTDADTSSWSIIPFPGRLCQLVTCTNQKCYFSRNLPIFSPFYHILAHFLPKCNAFRNKKAQLLTFTHFLKS